MMEFVAPERIMQSEDQDEIEKLVSRSGSRCISQDRFVFSCADGRLVILNWSTMKNVIYHPFDPQLKNQLAMLNERQYLRALGSDFKHACELYWEHAAIKTGDAL
ncbi:hypothetical protein [Mesorhizobium sp. A623]